MITTKLAQPSARAFFRALPQGATINDKPATEWLAKKPRFVAAWPVDYRQCGSVAVFRFANVACFGFFVVALPGKGSNGVGAADTADTLGNFQK